MAIVGSRDYPLPGLVVEFVRRLAARTPDAVIISGKARGVDTWAAVAAREAGLQVVELPADWEQFGKRAGMIRNAEIVRQADRVVAFYDLLSRGTLNSIQCALRLGKPLLVIGPDGRVVLHDCFRQQGS